MTHGSGRALPALFSMIFGLAQTAAAFSGDDWPERFGFTLRRAPTVSIHYGASQGSLSGLGQSFTDPRAAEFRIGGSREYMKEEGILMHRYNYVTLGNISTDLGTATSEGKINSNLWRFGLGWEKGYGYALNSGLTPSAVLLYHAHGIHWSKLQVKDPVADAADKELIDVFNDTFRFGTMTEGGVRLRVLPMLVFDAGYERAVVFRRHLFWKSLGSAAIEGVALWYIDEFVENVLESSPGAVPVVNFVLKNAVSYAAYQLRKEKMNYPFRSESPLFHDTFKFGVTFVF